MLQEIKIKYFNELPQRSRVRVMNEYEQHESCPRQRVKPQMDRYTVGKR